MQTVIPIWAIRMRSATKLLWLMCVWDTVYCTSRPTVTLTQGVLEGTWLRSKTNRQIAAFKGIPYAEPPVGNLRFQSPQPAKPWNGTRDASQEGASCVQTGSLDAINSSEDCLFLNVFTPNLNSSGLPVVVFIHGGSFKTGSSSTLMYGPEFLLDHNVVYVAMNYRLYVLGFLSLEEKALPGNFGLKDQREALRWINQNIHHFGGDPNKVTLFGESAGSICVHYHMIFTAHEGLFRAGICHSGTAMSLGFQRSGDQKPLVDHILNATNCRSDNSSAVVECLRKIDALNLTMIAASQAPSAESLLWQVDFAPVLEPKCVKDAFVTSAPFNKTLSLPLLIGTNLYESVAFVIADLLNDTTDTKFEYFDKNYKTIVPNNLMFKSSAENPSLVAEKLRSFYLQDKPINRENVIQLINMMNDGMFNYGTKETVLKNKNKTYLYSYNYEASFPLLNLLGYNISFRPVHAEELLNFFPFEILQVQKIANKTDELMHIKLVNIWTHFIQNLDPNVGEEGVGWKPVTGADLEYLNIDGPDNLTMASHFYSQRMNFWQNLPFRNKPYPDSIGCSSSQFDKSSSLTSFGTAVVSKVKSVISGILGDHKTLL